MAGRYTVEDCRQLDINRFTRDKYLTCSPFRWYWKNEEGETKASINIWPEPAGLKLQYTITIRGEKKEMNYLVPVAYVRVGYGERPYFCCPLCGNRCLKLYLNSHHFTCRTCANLTYTSTRERAADRAMRKCRKIRRRIGASEGTVDSISPQDKPKRMRWNTFNRLERQANALEAEGWRLFQMAIRWPQFWGE